MGDCKRKNAMTAGEKTRIGRQLSGPLRGLARRSAHLLGTFPRAAMEVAFPTSCVGCDGEIVGTDMNPHDAPFCRACREEFAMNAGHACPRCAMPLPAGACEAPATDKRRSPGCLHCRGRRFSFHGALAAGRYTGRLRELVLKMKRAEADCVSLAMGRFIWQSCGEQLAAAEADLIAPVPMHWRRRMMHGTNSAALLAEVLAARLHTPLANRLVRRNRNTPPQFSLSPPQRRANVRGCFAVRPSKRLKNAHVLLVDDIMTSGATCNEAARVLRRAGARRVTVVVAARAVSQ
jgi:ComF family protein